MKSSKIVVAVVFIIVFAVTAAMAQSSSRDNPRVLSSGDVTGTLNDHNQESFYSFTAGPGEVTITLDVQARRNDIGNMSFELLARDGSTSLLCCYGAQGDSGGTGRDTASIKLPKRQTVVLYIKSGPVGGGTYHVRVTGAAMFGGQMAGANDSGNKNENSNFHGGSHSGGAAVDVPASGILHIRMKDGTVKDIDLSRVRDISIH